MPEKVFSRCDIWGSMYFLLLQDIPELATVGMNSILTELMNKRKTTQISLASPSVENVVVASEVNIAKGFSAVRVLNPKPVLCPKNECTIVDEGRDVYRDNWHPSGYGSQKLSPLISRVLVELLNQ